MQPFQGEAVDFLITYLERGFMVSSLPTTASGPLFFHYCIKTRVSLRLMPLDGTMLDPSVIYTPL